ncbi:DDB1B, partial [Symbiodinium pilosum]
QLRRERMQALEAGDETASLSFPGAEKEREAARKKQAAKEAELAEAGKELPLERPSIEKRLFGEGGHRPAKVARTDDRRSGGDRDRERLGDQPRHRSSLGARDERGRDQRLERERDRYPDRYPERDAYGSQQRAPDRSRHSGSNSRSHASTGSQIPGSQPRHDRSYGADRAAARSYDVQSGTRRDPPNAPSRELSDREAARRREAPQTAYRRDANTAAHGKPPSTAQTSRDREGTRTSSGTQNRDTRNAAAIPSAGKGGAASHGRGTGKGSWRQKDLDPLDAFMAGMERHGEAFATGDVPAEPLRPPQPPPAPP